MGGLKKPAVPFVPVLSDETTRALSGWNTNPKVYRGKLTDEGREFLAATASFEVIDPGIDGFFASSRIVTRSEQNDALIRAEKARSAHLLKNNLRCPRCGYGFAAGCLYVGGVREYWKCCRHCWANHPVETKDAVRREEAKHGTHRTVFGGNARPEGEGRQRGVVGRPEP